MAILRAREQTRRGKGMAAAAESVRGWLGPKRPARGDGGPGAGPLSSIVLGSGQLVAGGLSPTRDALRARPAVWGLAAGLVATMAIFEGAPACRLRQESSGTAPIRTQLRKTFAPPVG